LLSAAFLRGRHGPPLLLTKEVEPLAVEYVSCKGLVRARDREPQGSAPSGIRLAGLGPDDFALNSSRLQSRGGSSQIAELALEYDYRILIHVPSLLIWLVGGDETNRTSCHSLVPAHKRLWAR